MGAPSKSEPALDVMDDYADFESRTAYSAYSDRSGYGGSRSRDPSPGFRRDQERGPYYERDQRGYGTRAKSVDQDLNVGYGRDYSRGRSIDRGLDDDQMYKRDRSRGRSIDRGLDEERGYARERSRGRSLDRDLDDPRSYGKESSRGRTLDRDDRNAQHSPDRQHGRSSADRRYDQNIQKSRSRDRLQSRSPSPIGHGDSDTTSVLLTKKKSNEGKHYILFFYFLFNNLHFILICSCFIF